MSPLLRVLIAAVSHESALPLVWELKRGGYDPVTERVESRATLESALASERWDALVIAVPLGELGALEALAIVGRRGLDLPSIVVSADGGEAAAVEAIKAGAHDFVPQRHIARLADAIERETRLALERAARRRSEQDMYDRWTRLDRLTDNAPGMLFRLVRDAAGEISFSFVSAGARALIGAEAEALARDAAVFFERIDRADRESLDRALGRSAAELGRVDWDGRLAAGPGGGTRWINVRATARRIELGAVVWEGVTADITERKLAELELREARRQLSEMSTHVQEAKERERDRITRELRDGVGGNLAAIKMDLVWLAGRVASEDAAARARSTEALIDRTIDATNRMARDLRPGILDVGLVVAIEWLAEEFQRRYGVPCGVICGEEDIALAPEASVAVFRIFEELLANVAAHACATRVEVTLQRTGRLVLLEVADNGRGLQPGDSGRPGAFGIRAMAERARSLGGSLAVDAAPEGGTRAVLYVPTDAGPDTDGSTDPRSEPEAAP